MEQAKQFQMVTALTIKFQNHKGLQLDLVKVLYFTSGAQKSYVIYTKPWRCYHFGINMLYLSCIFPIILLCFSLTHTETHTVTLYYVSETYTNIHMHTCLLAPSSYTHTNYITLIQTLHCVEFIYTYTHTLHYSDTHLLAYTNIYICASITYSLKSLFSLFLQLTHICIVLCCAINPHTPLILLLLCM